MWSHRPRVLQSRWSTGILPAFPAIKRIQEVNDSSEVGRELRAIDRALELDPGNVELLGQRARYSAQQANILQKRLDLVNAALSSGEVERGSRAYDRLQREVATTSKRLSDAETATRDAFEAFKRAADGADDLSSTEVRRLYDAASGNHMFTASPDEAAALLDAGWADEVVGFLVG